MTNNKNWKEDLDVARYVTKSREWPELIGEAEEIDYATVKRYKVEKDFEWERPLLRLYGDIYNNFKHWLFKQANTKFWYNLSSIEDAYKMYMKETKIYDEPSEEDLKKFDDLMDELKVQELPTLTNNGRRNSMEIAEKIRKDAQRLFFDGEAKEIFCAGLIDLEGLKDLYEFEFMELPYTRNWTSGWCIYAAIVSHRQREEHKKNGTWGK